MRHGGAHKGTGAQALYRAGRQDAHSHCQRRQQFSPGRWFTPCLQVGNETLNDTFVNVITGSEDYSFKLMRKNQV